jgi:polar amino acid transport system permease protein
MNYTFRFTPVIARIDQLLDGLATTLWLSAAAIALGFLVGIGGALAGRSRSRMLRGATLAYVEAIRNTPLLAQLFFVYFGLPALGIRLEALTAALLTLVINLGAYATEIVRAGIDAVPVGQRDAGAALGLTRWQIMRLIVLKPALKIVFPALASQFTLLMLATSILSQIGIEELFHMASIVDTTTYRSFEVYAVTCGFYLAATLAFRLLFAIVHRLAFAERVFAERIFAGETPGAAPPAVGSADIVVPP